MTFRWHFNFSSGREKQAAERGFVSAQWCSRAELLHSSSFAFLRPIFFFLARVFGKGGRNSLVLTGWDQRVCGGCWGGEFSESHIRQVLGSDL